MPERPGVFLTGTFDVANYGDLLFPLVARARLAAAGLDVIPVSPTATLPGFADALAPVAAGRMLADDTLDARGILVGGGYILMTQPATGMAAYDAAGVAAEAYPSLWLGAALAAALRDIPLAWNAPGAPFPFASRRLEEAILPALRAADYLSVRDAQSARMFGPAAPGLAVVPDTALDLPMVWPAAELAALHRARLAAWGLKPDTRTLALHVRARALGDPDDLAARIAEVAAGTGLVPVLLVLGAALGDRQVARRLSAALPCPHGLLDDAAGLRDLAAAIAGSAAYVGGSFHGYVTAAAYGVPGVMVAIPAHGKFAGLLAQLDRPGDLARDWAGAFDRLHQHWRAGRAGALPVGVPAALDRHWAAIVAVLGRPDRGHDRRLAFLRQHLRRGAAQQGAGWLVTPHLSGLGRPRREAG